VIRKSGRILMVEPDKILSSDEKKCWINGSAIALILVGYGMSIFCLIHPFWWMNLIGFSLTIQSLIWAAYFVHESLHGNIFRHPRWNNAVGWVMLFLTGSCYGKYRDLVDNHLAHHKLRADITTFNLTNFLRKLPKTIYWIIIGLEWLYFPVIELILRWKIILSPFFNFERIVRIQVKNRESMKQW
jgi:fatty acid desaturase